MFKKENIISCKEYVSKCKEEMKVYINSLNKKPTLAVVQIDENPASCSYIKEKKKDCSEVGIKVYHYHYYSENISQKELCDVINQLNHDDNINGIIIQLPIPDKYDVKELQNYISPVKDVDGFRRDSFHNPCTPQGIMDWLEFNNYNLEGKNAVVIGRSEIVGKPLVNMLIEEGATVTCCNSKTNRQTLINHLKSVNIVFSAVGKARFLDVYNFANMVVGNDLEIVVDIGINRDKNDKLCGDIDGTGFDKYLPNTYLTPVPGSVGLLTRCKLLDNVIVAYNEMRNNK